MNKTLNASLTYLFGGALCLGTFFYSNNVLDKRTEQLIQTTPGLKRINEIESELESMLKNINSQQALETYRTQTSFAEKYDALKKEYARTITPEILEAQPKLLKNKQYSSDNRLFAIFSLVLSSIGVAGLALYLTEKKGERFPIHPAEAATPSSADY